MIEKLEPNAIRLIGGASLREMSPEQIDELQHALHGSRRDRRLAERKLRRLGIKVEYGAEAGPNRPVTTAQG